VQTYFRRVEFEKVRWQSQSNFLDQLR
jgi:hypothetical protein